MASLTSQLIVRLVDGVTGPAGAAAKSLGLLKAAGRGMAGLGDPRVIQRNLRTVARSAREVGANVATPLALLGAFGAKTAFEFEKAGNFLEALGEATGAQRKEFEGFANVLNAKYPQSLTEILKTGTELLKAGLDWKQMMGALDPTLATAILGDMKPSEVAAIISSSLNAFQMPMETAEQALRSTTVVSDRLSFAAIETTANLKDMGEMFKYVAGAATATGNEIDEVTTLAMAFAKNKVVGSEAGVALRSAIVRLARGLSKEGRAAMERSGLNLADYMRGAQPVTADRVIGGLMAGGIDANPIRKQIEALIDDPTLKTAPTRLAAKITALVQEELTRSGSAMDASVIAENVQDSVVAAGSKIDLMKFFTDLRDKVASGAMTMGDISRILEGRHFARYQALLQSDLGAIRKRIETEATGYTLARYGITLKGIVGPVLEASAAFETLATSIGRAVFPEVAGYLSSLANAVKELAKTDPSTLKWFTYLAAGLVALVPVGMAIGGFVAGVTGLSAVIKVLAGGVAMLAGVVGGPILAGLAVFAAAIAGVVIYRNEIAQFATYIGNLAVEFGRLGAQLASDLASKIKAGAAGLYEAGVHLLSQLWEGMKAKAAEIIGWATGIGSRIKGALSFGGGGGTKPSGATGSWGAPPGRVSGGPVTRGRAYIVGEKRAELFVPGESGTVYPSAGMGGGAPVVTVNTAVHVSGAGDPQAVAQAAAELVARRVREVFRGIQSDTGVVFT